MHFGCVHFVLLNVVQKIQPENSYNSCSTIYKGTMPFSVPFPVANSLKKVKNTDLVNKMNASFSLAQQF